MPPKKSLDSKPTRSKKRFSNLPSISEEESQSQADASEIPLQVVVEPRGLNSAYEDPSTDTFLPPPPSNDPPQPSQISGQPPQEPESKERIIPQIVIHQAASSSSINFDYSDDPKKRKKSRLVLINYNQREKFTTNHVKTSKYTYYSFLPIFLYEQFRRYSNIFFLLIAIIQQIPDVSPTGRWTTAGPFAIILFVSAIKEVIEDYKRHKADEITNNREVEVLRHQEFKYIKWQDVNVGDFIRLENDNFIPADVVLYSTSDPSGMCYIETSNLDGETNLKVRQALPQTCQMSGKEDFVTIRGFIECGIPNRQVYEFTGSINLESEEHLLPLGPDQLLLRGAQIRNTNWIYGQVMYTGHETKLMKNSTKPPLKRSSVDKTTNQQIIMLFMLLIAISLMSALFSILLIKESEIHEYVGTVPITGGKAMIFLYNFLTYIILYNNLIPISLTVTLEVVRFIQGMFINWDKDMYHLESDTAATAKTSNLNEELGKIRYIFSDKTGTLTMNVMEFKGCSVSGILYSSEALFPTDKLSPLLDSLLKDKGSDGRIREFLVLLAVCHNVITETKTSIDGVLEIIYNAASPDERALVMGARKLGFEFVKRTPSIIEITVMGRSQEFEILNMIDFTSSRKRMSIVVRCPDGKIRLYCKGADSVIYERLAKSGSADYMCRKTEEHLQSFATEGLRTLCCAMKILTEQDFFEWNILYKKAANEIEEREEKVEAVAELLENELTLIGATAIEDKLQEFVPETIAALLEAKISVWVLTGDKQETAINIGNSCKLITPTMALLMINQETDDNTLDCINAYAKELEIDLAEFKNKAAFQKIVPRDAAVVIDGKTLTFAMTERTQRHFLSLCCNCRAVIVCRAAPMQKAEIVECVTNLTGATTLAIGDGTEQTYRISGANDVAMIQKAHVGIGISGKEGLQAACASDYAIGQFSYLKKLLFVHGAWNHDRITKTVFYSLYKNICLYIMELWFAIYSAWSGQVIFERWTIGCYNIMFTCLQPLCIGIFERNCNMTLRMNNPNLYHSTSNGAFSFAKFLIWIFNSLVHSICIFWFSLLLLGFGTGLIWNHGRDGSYLIWGNFIYTCVVVVVSLKFGLETRAWTKYTHISLWGSILLWLVFLLVYSYLWYITAIGSEIFNQAEQVYSSILFWIGCIVIPLATLIPDIIYKSAQGSIFFTEPDVYRENDIIEERERQKIIKQNLKDNPPTNDPQKETGKEISITETEQSSGNNLDDTNDKPTLTEGKTSKTDSNKLDRIAEEEQKNSQNSKPKKKRSTQHVSQKLALIDDNDDDENDDETSSSAVENGEQDKDDKEEIKEEKEEETKSVRRLTPIVLTYNPLSNDISRQTLGAVFLKSSSNEDDDTADKNEESNSPAVQGEGETPAGGSTQANQGPQSTSRDKQVPKSQKGDSLLWAFSDDRNNALCFVQ